MAIYQCFLRFLSRPIAFNLSINTLPKAFSEASTSLVEETKSNVTSRDGYILLFVVFVHWPNLNLFSLTSFFDLRSFAGPIPQSTMDGHQQEPLPEGWVIKESRSHPGNYYYFNTATQESQWDHPNAPASRQETVRVLHLLKKHVGSRRPSSWRNETITLPKEDAIQELESLRAQIESASDVEALFRELASVESDCSRFDCVREGISRILFCFNLSSLLLLLS